MGEWGGDAVIPFLGERRGGRRCVRDAGDPYPTRFKPGASYHSKS